MKRIDGGVGLKRSNCWMLTLQYFVRLGQEMLMDEDYGDEEIETELAPISVQLAYVRQVNVKPVLLFIFSSFLRTVIFSGSV